MSSSSLSSFGHCSRSPWADLPKQYGSGSTCWRQLRDWEEQDVWLTIWRSLLARLDEGEFHVSAPNNFTIKSWSYN